MRYSLFLLVFMLTACGTEDTATKKYSIKNNSGTITRSADNILSVSATLVRDDEAQAGVDVIFLIDCDGNTRESLEATTDDDGIATASTTEAVPEQNCSVTLIIDDSNEMTPLDIAAEDNTNDPEPPTNPAPNKLMGKIHHITWDSNSMNLNTCNYSTGVLLFKADDPKKITIIRNAPQNGDIHLLALAVKGAKSIDGKDPSCRIGTTDIVFDSSAYNDTTTAAQFHKFNCKDQTCFTLNYRENQQIWTVGGNGNASDAKANSFKWIRRTASTNSNNETVHSYTVYFFKS